MIIYSPMINEIDHISVESAMQVYNGPSIEHDLLVFDDFEEFQLSAFPSVWTVFSSPYVSAEKHIIQ